MDFDALMGKYATKEDASAPLHSSSSSSEQATHSGLTKKSAFRRNRVDRREPGKVTELEDGNYKLERMFGAYELWSEDWIGDPDDIIVSFEAKATNDVTILLSIEKGITTGALYEIVIGGWKNAKTTVRTEVQGQERATDFTPNMCNAETFLTYWVGLRNGKLAVGTGEKPGRNVLLAWSNPQHDPEDVQPCCVSFTTWDGVMLLRNIRILSSAGLDYEWIAELGSPAEWVAKYIPTYIAALEEERAANIARAERFGTGFVPPNPRQALGRMPFIEREKAIASMAGRLRTGFVTGFDTTSASELENKHARAARFGIAENANEGATSTSIGLLPSDQEFDAKRARAARFGVPLVEQTKLVSMAAGVPIKRSDPTAEDDIRDDTLHIFGDLTGITSKHVLQTFQDFNPSHLEWLNDCAVNVVFADRFTCERARKSLCRDIPSPITSSVGGEMGADRAAFDDDLNRMIGSGWKFTVIKDKRNETVYVLVRNASLSDIKSEKLEPDVLRSQSANKRVKPLTEETESDSAEAKRTRQAPVDTD
jgi:hypothetical protein